MRLGELWLVNFPFTDGSSTKLRPVLLVSSDKFNVGGDVVVVPIRRYFSDGSAICPASRLTKSAAYSNRSSASAAACNGTIESAGFFCYGLYLGR